MPLACSWQQHDQAEERHQQSQRDKREAHGVIPVDKGKRHSQPHAERGDAAPELDSRAQSGQRSPAEARRQIVSRALMPVDTRLTLTQISASPALSRQRCIRRAQDHPPSDNDIQAARHLGATDSLQQMSRPSVGQS
jgi:hypothetical protein